MTSQPSQPSVYQKKYRNGPGPYFFVWSGVFAYLFADYRGVWEVEMDSVTLVRMQNFVRINNEKEIEIDITGQMVYNHLKNN
mgnify:CR=1 FL=1